MSLGSMSFWQIKQLLNDHGTTVTISRPASKVYNPSTGQYEVDGGTAAQTQTAKVAIVNYSEDQLLGDVKRGDRRAIISASGLSFSPDTEDTISGLGDSANIVSVQTINQSGTVVGYICQVRD